LEIATKECLKERNLKNESAQESARYVVIENRTLFLAWEPSTPVPNYQAATFLCKSHCNTHELTVGKINGATFN